MNNFGYELELALREMAEFQHQAAQDALVKEIKKARRAEHNSTLGSLIRRSLTKLLKRRPPKASIISISGQPAATRASENE